MSARPIHGVAFLTCWFTLKGVCCCCGEIWSKRTRVFEDDVFIENTRLVGGSKTQDLNLRADLVLNMSRGPPGQWFPETEYWASAIFVGTSGIPPKIIYWSVKSYTLRTFKFFSLFNVHVSGTIFFQQLPIKKKELISFTSSDFCLFIIHRNICRIIYPYQLTSATHMGGDKVMWLEKISCFFIKLLIRYEIHSLINEHWNFD